MIRSLALSVAVACVGVSHAAAQLPLPAASLPEYSAAGAGPISIRPPTDSLPTDIESNDSEPLFTEPEFTSPTPDTFDLQSSVADEFRFDLKPTIRLRGRIETEAVVASQSAQSQATIGDLQNGFGFRRVRLGAQGALEESTSWVSEVELAGGNVRLRDVFIGFDAIPGFSQIRIGHFREPYNLEGMTSSNFITFLERSPQNVLSPVRNWGVCSYWWDDAELWLYSLGVFRDGTNNGGQSTGDGDNWAYTTRLTALPIYNSNANNFRLVHVGAAFSQRVPPNGELRFTPRDVSNLLTVDDNPGSPFLPSLTIPTNGYQLYNLQIAWLRGPFSLQGEWSSAAVQQTNAGSIFVHGMYVYCSYFLTGEHRSYNRTRGSFDQIDVLRPVTRARTARRGRGAWELATRFAYLDFDSANLPLDENNLFVGTKLYEASVGVNWYLNTYTRIMTDYTAGMPDKFGFAPTIAHVYGLRAALYW